MPADKSLTSFDVGGDSPPHLLAPLPRPAVPPGTPPGLVARLAESFGWPGAWGGPVAAGLPGLLLDGAPNWPAGWGRGATGTTYDRKAGKDTPKFWSEMELRAFRVMSRWLWDTNPFMLGFGARLVDYHIGKGFQWQACLKGAKKQAYATGLANKDDPAARLVEKGQRVLDQWRDRVQWPLRSREGFKRLRRDGEVIQRFGRGPGNSLPWVRWVNPEQVGSPVGDTVSDESFGVRTAPGDAERVTAVYVRDHDGDGAEGEWVGADRDDPAARVLFFKANTDADVKRGLPDSFSVHEYLDECKNLVRNLVVVACAQAAIAWREGFPAASAEQVRALIPQAFPRPDVPPWAAGGADTVYSERVAAGTVLRTEGSREFQPGPTSTGVANYVEAEQAALRACCVRWGMPPYMTAKADDINFASSLTAGSPFAVAVEGGQVEWGAVERATAMKVLDLACEAGLLTPAERAALDVEVTPPTVITPDPGAETTRNKTLFDAKILDPYTWMQREGLDPAHVEANWRAWNERNGPQPAPGAGAQPGSPPPGPPDPFGEGVVREGFTGTVTDSAGRERHYVDGKRVAKKPGDQKDEDAPGPKPSAPGDGGARGRSRPDPTDWRQPDWVHAPTGRSENRYVNRYTGRVAYTGKPPKGRSEEQRRAAVEERAKRLEEPAGITRGADAAKAFAGKSGIDPDHLTALAGGQPGSRVSAFAGSTPGTLNLSIDHPDTTEWRRSLSVAADGSLELYNAMFFLRPNAQGSGFGTTAFAAQVAGAVAAGVSRIKTCAGRGTLDGVPMNGYATWPRLGYDAPLDAGQRAKLPEGLKGAKTVLDLYESKEGRDWWKENGTTTGMTFDVSPGSRSLKTLNAYLAANGKPEIEYTAGQAAANAGRQQARAGAKAADAVSPVHARNAERATRAGLDAAAVRAAAEKGVELVYDPGNRLAPADRLDAAYTFAMHRAAAGRAAERLTSEFAGLVQKRYHGYAAAYGIDPGEVDREAGAVGRRDAGVLYEPDEKKAVRAAYARAFDSLRSRNRD